MRLVCETKTRKEIAAGAIPQSEGTVKRHISEILAKTGYDNILRLAVHAVANRPYRAQHEPKGSNKLRNRLAAPLQLAPRPP